MPLFVDSHTGHPHRTLKYFNSLLNQHCANLAYGKMHGTPHFSCRFHFEFLIVKIGHLSIRTQRLRTGHNFF